MSLQNNLHEVKNNVDEFEQGLCEYRKNAVKTILDKNIPLLYKLHYNYVKSLLNKKRTTKNEKVIINGIELELIKSQKEFFTSSLKKLICNDK